ncbi:MAG: pyridoxal phosphate-dependent aminotransferase [Victivallales bacterium]|nr:pyridoxal phosphate-dependent aminotransferase [Victivallales bacterium]MCF7888745.1 pyridoxal phosphate-dependent aminotransferase [Victivallales bacterium]
MNNNTPKESTIRLMTRLANKHNAVNLSQGFTDMPVIFETLWGLITAAAGGNQKTADFINSATVKDIIKKLNCNEEDFKNLSLKEIFRKIQGKKDVFNQYSYPFGMPELRKTIADYTKTHRGFRPDSETEITVTAGATEGFFASLMTVCSPGDEIIIIQPYHEMYPTQAAIAKVVPKFITLHQDTSGKWKLNTEELKNSINEKTKVLILNTPHNPTGKVFSEKEILEIAEICKKNNIFIFTDEIYEHILFNGLRHYTPAAYKEYKDITFLINSISKTANATGWRIGWVISPEHSTKKLRGIHDTTVMQAPTPLQKATVKLLEMDREFYKNIYIKYKENCRILVEKLRETGFKVAYPEGSYYLFADYTNVKKLKDMTPMDAAVCLITNFGVASVPGDNFYSVGSDGNRYLRFAFCRSLESIKKAADRLNMLNCN